MTARVSVRRAAAADGPAVSAVLADAFATDPVLSWLLPPTIPRRSKRLSRLWSVTTAGYLRNHKPVFVTDDGDGAALWAPPGKWVPSVPDQLRDLLPMTSVFRTALVRASRMQSQIIAAHPRRPHWYLYAIGARSGSQGRGIGSALLQEMLASIDAAAEPAYLESSNERNVPLYERYGFTVVEELTIDRGGPTLWRMWRDPAA